VVVGCEKRDARFVIDERKKFQDFLGPLNYPVRLLSNLGEATVYPKAEVISRWAGIGNNDRNASGETWRAFDEVPEA
jgi:hypothetical protein